MLGLQLQGKHELVKFESRLSICDSMMVRSSETLYGLNWLYPTNPLLVEGLLGAQGTGDLALC